MSTDLTTDLPPAKASAETLRVATDLGAALVKPTIIERNPEHAALAVVVPAGYQVASLRVDGDEYRDYPRHKTGAPVVYDPASFTLYWTKHHQDGESELYADYREGRIVGVLDAHSDALAGWKKHTVTLALQKNPTWDAWKAASGKLLPQTQFAEILEQLVADIVEPDGATMLEIATTLSATRSAVYDAKATRLDNGDRRFSFDETTTARAGAGRGQVDIPSKFLIRAQPFVGGPTTRVEALLRYRVGDSGLQLGYVLVRPDDAVRTVFDAVVAELEDAIQTPVMRGTR